MGRISSTKEKRTSFNNEGQPIDFYQFHVRELDKKEVVNLYTQECICKEFQVAQLPCSHVIAAAQDCNINIYSLSANYYTNE